jgi:hypothetical protein
MCSLLSTVRVLALTDAFRQDQRMVDKQMTVKEILALVRKSCGYAKKNALATALGETPQTVGQWESRNSISRDGEDALHNVTGISRQFLRDRKGDPFPNGPKVARLTVPGSREKAQLELLVERQATDIDVLRNCLNCLVSVLVENEPRLSAQIGRGVKAIQKDNKPADRGFYAEFLKVLDEAQDSSEAALLAFRRREASQRA